jgi:hypothetical protein
LNNALRLAALLALAVSTTLAQAANNAEDCKKEGGVWRENAAMGGFCFKKLASDAGVARPDDGDTAIGTEKANHNTARSNKSTVAKPSDDAVDSAAAATPDGTRPRFKAGAELTDKVN